MTKWSLENPNDELSMTEEEWAEAERDHWNGEGHIEFFVIQNVPGTFEIEVLDYSGCASGMQDTLGIEYMVEDFCIRGELREGVTYTMNKLAVHWTRGDGWTYDDDVEYNYESLTSHVTLIGYLTYKAKMIWWRQVQCRLKILKKRITDAE